MSAWSIRAALAVSYSRSVQTQTTGKSWPRTGALIARICTTASDAVVAARSVPGLIAMIRFSMLPQAA
jgi:hypothetical protein